MHLNRLWHGAHLPTHFNPSLKLFEDEDRSSTLSFEFRYELAQVLGKSSLKQTMGLLPDDSVSYFRRITPLKKKHQDFRALQIESEILLKQPDLG